MRKNDSSNPKNVLQNTNERTCDCLLYFTFLSCLHGTVALFWGVISNFFLTWMFFNAHNNGIATKLVEKIGREHLAGPPFCNAHAALVWLYLTFILFFYLLYDSWLRLAFSYFYHIRYFIKKCSWKFRKDHRKDFWWSLFRLTTLLKSDYNTDVFLWILQNFQGHLFSKTSANGYGRSFVERWRKNFFWENFCVFHKIYIICRKKVFLLKKV